MTMPGRLKSGIWFGLRLILAAVFLGAAAHKLWYPHDFAVSVFRYQLLPHALINLFALYLPVLEVLCALLLFVPRWESAASAILLGLLAVFTAAITSNIIRGVDISCGCFSASSESGHIGWLNIIRNLALMLLAMVVCVHARITRDDRADNP